VAGRVFARLSVTTACDTLRTGQLTAQRGQTITHSPPDASADTSWPLTGIDPPPNAVSLTATSVPTSDIRRPASGVRRPASWRLLVRGGPRVSPVILIDDIHRAAERLNGVARRTPVITNPVIDSLAGCQVFLKAENLQVTGAFKFRGACNAVGCMDTDQLSGGVVAFSSGNHAKAVATAAQLCRTTAVIVMPTDAPPEKVDGTKAAGARVVFYDRFGEDRAAIAAEIAEREGRLLIAPYDNPLVMAGQGTVGLELMDQVTNLDALFVCVGGGGLLAGCATAVHAGSGSVEVFGVEPEASNDHALSAAAGERVAVQVQPTIADGQQVSTPGRLTWPVTARLTKAFLTVSDAEIVATMKLLFEHAKLVVEPSGASALAALVHQDLPDLRGKRVGVTLSGGNISPDRFHSLVG